MKKLILVFLLAINTIVFAQNINGRFSSSVYTFERYDSLNSSENYVRAYEMLNLNLNYDKFSVRSYMNLETDLTKEQISDPRLRFYNLYLEARDLLNIATVKVGRQPIINNVIGGLFDGGSVTLKHSDYKLNAFYGGNVPAYQKLEITNNIKDNFIMGGKFTTTVIPNSQLSVGYVNKNFKPDSYFADRLDPNLNLIEVEIENKSNQYQFVTGELNYTMPEIVQAFFRYDYDLNFNQSSRFEFDARTEAVKDLGLNVYYNFREPKIRYNSIFSVFDYGNTHEVELGADYKINRMITVIGKFGNVQYKDENSQRIGIGLSTSYGSVNYRKTFGYAGELDAVSLYSGYTLFDGLLTPSVGLSYTNYKLSPDAESNSITSLLVGTNIRPFRMLSFDLQGQYMDNKIYKNDLRLFFKLNYWFNLNI
ncbi:MAG: hypothetical protein RBR74_04405 [Ignavibacteriaceae bacterium]|jgi:hypothetical protein|nr:hypothetical protein [Ignavibacteriaceae bacterium]